MEDTEERRWLVRRLIELRLRLEEVKETNEDQTALNSMNEANKVLLGHHFSLQIFPLSTSKYYCDQCSGIIWNAIHSWYLCAGEPHSYIYNISKNSLCICYMSVLTQR